jgi:hypothetical protein
MVTMTNLYRSGILNLGKPYASILGMWIHQDKPLNFRAHLAKFHSYEPTCTFLSSGRFPIEPAMAAA